MGMAAGARHRLDCSRHRCAGRYARGHDDFRMLVGWLLLASGIFHVIHLSERKAADNRLEPAIGFVVLAVNHPESLICSPRDAGDRRASLLRWLDRSSIAASENNATMPRRLTAQLVIALEALSVITT